MRTFRLVRSFVTRMDIDSSIQSILIRKNGIPPSKITPEATFAELGLDNFDSAELIMSLQIKYDLDIEVEDIESVKSIPEAIALLEDYLSKEAK